MRILKDINFIALLMVDIPGAVQSINFTILMATLLDGFLMRSLISLPIKILVTVSIPMRIAKVMIQKEIHPSMVLIL